MEEAATARGWTVVLHTDFARWIGLVRIHARGSIACAASKRITGTRFARVELHRKIVAH